MSRGNYKPFNPDEIDSSLTRVVAHRDHTYLMFPFIDGRQSEPKFTSLSVTMQSASVTPKDLAAISALAKSTAVGGEWYLNFSTAWLLPPDTGNDAVKPATLRRVQRR